MFQNLETIWFMLAPMIRIPVFYHSSPCFQFKPEELWPPGMNLTKSLLEAYHKPFRVYHKPFQVYPKRFRVYHKAFEVFHKPLKVDHKPLDAHHKPLNAYHKNNRLYSPTFKNDE